MKKDFQSHSTYSNYTNYTNTTHEGEFKRKKCKKCNDLTGDKCVEVTRETLNKIQAEYVPGTREYVSTYNKKAYQTILDARKKVNMIYKARLDKKYPTTITEFKNTLAFLYASHIKAITLYKKHLDEIAI
jgi:hypothetical protein